MSVVIYEKKDGIAYITLNRPEAMNSFNDEMNEALEKVWIDYKNDNSLLVAIVTGAGGRAFSTGADLKEMRAKGQAAGTRGLSQPLRFDVYKPLIAAIDGYVAGGGFLLMLQSDVRIATARSRIGDGEPRIGWPGHLNLPRIIPMPAAQYLLVTGALVPAEEALRMGLLYKVLPDRESLMQEALRIAEEIKLCSPLAVQLAKRLMYRGISQPWAALDAEAAPLLKQLRETEDAKEGIRAFAEKRKPVWKMR
ncbi:MAG: enoyl-CoA hydratase/isomerase family protein [Chloroflexi bacterium]|nr:enoyl-CoA hydratase/isomerase family protein [Chloroflexota bacterium]